MNDFKNKRDGVRREGFASSGFEGRNNKRGFKTSVRGLNKPNGGRATGEQRKSPTSFNPNFSPQSNSRFGRGDGSHRSTRSFSATGRGGFKAQGGFQKNRPFAGGAAQRSPFDEDTRLYDNTRPYTRNESNMRKPFGKTGNTARTFDKRKTNAPHKRRIEYKEEAYDPNKPIRLNKFIANAGMCARREADKFIAAGVVKVNGEVVTELGRKVLRSDVVHFHDQQIKAEKKIYVLLNKPKGYVTTSEDPRNRKTVLELVRDACMERIYPVGRLDRESTGVLMLTNDGDMASKLTHPRFLKKKVYHVYLDKKISSADLLQIAEGVTLEDGFIRADAVEYADPKDKKQVGIELHSGKNRIVRRIFQSLGYTVEKLDRVYFAGLTKKNLRRGDWRYLTEEEVNMLRMGAYE